MTMPSKDADEYLSEASATLEDGTRIDLLAPEAETFAETQEGEAGKNVSGQQNVATTEEGAKGKRKGQRTFGSLSPQEAGRKSAQARRERSLAQAEQIRAQSDGRVLLVHVPVQVGNIVARLSADAEKGDARASAELRTWMREYPAEDTTDLAALDRRTRQQVIARLLAEIEAEEGRPPASPEA